MEWIIFVDLGLVVAVVAIAAILAAIGVAGVVVWIWPAVKIIVGILFAIAELYINVPKTTDFAIMFLATEGLYSEVLRRPGLCEEIQNKYRIMICGPTTITAFLNTLNVGFRTIALNKKTTEIQKTLSMQSNQKMLHKKQSSSTEQLP